MGTPAIGNPGRNLKSKLPPARKAGGFFNWELRVPAPARGPVANIKRCPPRGEGSSSAFLSADLSQAKIHASNGPHSYNDQEHYSSLLQSMAPPEELALPTGGLVT